MRTGFHCIVLKKHDRQKVREKFKVSEGTLSVALNFRPQLKGKRVREIRDYAINVMNAIYY